MILSKFILLLLSFNPAEARELTPFETIKKANPLIDIGREFLFSGEADDKNKEAPHPIVEYVNVSSTNDPSERPAFIFDKVDYHRMVVFYSPACPHCIHFAPKYKQFARHFEALTKDKAQPMYAGLTLKFFGVSCSRYKNICRRQKVMGYPKLKLFLARSTHEIMLRPSDLHPLTILKALGEVFVTDTWQDTEDEGAAKEGDAQRQQEDGAQETTATSTGYFVDRTHGEIYGDAYLTFYNSMKESVFLDDQPLRIKRKQSLKQFLQLLERTLPPWRIHFMLKELLEDFDENVKVESHWLQSIELYPPRKREWSKGCQQHESPYTCGLWTLFHVMTVGLVEFNTATDKNGHVSFQSPKTAALMLREYIHHFFLCEECSTHFVQTFDACAFDRCNRLLDADPNTIESWREFPLWLLDVHNGVNLRLQKERFEREGRPSRQPVTPEEEQAVMWPSVKECDLCWINPLGADSKYNTTMMYSYLRLVYWPEDAASMATRRALTGVSRPEEAQDTRQTSHQQSSIGMPDEISVDGPYMVVVSASVVGVWIFFFWRKSHMDRLLGLRRTKIHSV